MDAATRTRILDAAASVFAARGFAGTGIRAISSRARVNLAAVSYHFGGKEPLYRETLRYVRARAYRRYPVTLGLPADAPPEVRLQAFVRSFLLRTSGDDEGREFGALVMREMVEPTSGLDQMIEESMRPLFEQLVGIVGDLLGAGGGPGLARACARGVISQCLFHLFCRSLAGRGSRAGADTAESRERAAAQILHFSLCAVREASRGGAPARQAAKARPRGAAPDRRSPAARQAGRRSGRERGRAAGGKGAG